MSLVVQKALHDFFSRYPDLIHKRWVIGYSGGRDSHVLLHTAVIVQAQLLISNLITFKALKAIHVNHQINPKANEWAKHCESTCKALDIDCQVINVNLDLQKGESLEAKARQARYEAIRVNLEPGDIFITAHTQDDQAETLLLQLIRGAGVQGLSSMGECKPFANTYHTRPLLNIAREVIEKASIDYQLSWITDDSNENTRFDRNFIRHEILPILKNRFKGVVPSLARSAQLCQEAARAQAIQAGQDFEKIQFKNQINANLLKELSFERQKAVIRYWISQNNYKYPSKLKLDDIIHQMNTASQDAMPCITWGDCVLRRYKNHWYCFDKSYKNNFIDCNHYKFNFKLEIVQGRGFRRSLIHNLNDIKIQYRQGSERCKPAGQPFSKSLKKWFQILEVPPWMRGSTPLIYYQDQLIGVADHFICEGWQVSKEDEWGFELNLIE